MLVVMMGLIKQSYSFYSTCTQTNILLYSLSHGVIKCLVPLLASQTIPVMASVPVSLVFSSAGYLSVSKRCAFTTLKHSTIELMVFVASGVCRMYNQILGNALIDRHSHLLRSLLIRCPSFTTVLVSMA